MLTHCNLNWNGISESYDDANDGFEWFKEGF